MLHFPFFLITVPGPLENSPSQLYPLCSSQDTSWGGSGTRLLSLNMVPLSYLCALEQITLPLCAYFFICKMGTIALTSLGCGEDKRYFIPMPSTQ